MKDNSVEEDNCACQFVAHDETTLHGNTHFFTQYRTNKNACTTADNNERGRPSVSSLHKQPPLLIPLNLTWPLWWLQTRFTMINQWCGCGVTASDHPRFCIDHNCFNGRYPTSPDLVSFTPKASRSGCRNNSNKNSQTLPTILNFLPVQKVGSLFYLLTVSGALSRL